MKFFQLTLFCGCGQKILKYKKGGRGRWIKVHKKRVLEFYEILFQKKMEGVVGTEIFCPSCQHRLATMQNISGKYVAKLNQGQIKIEK